MSQHIETQRRVAVECLDPWSRRVWNRNWIASTKKITIRVSTSVKVQFASELSSNRLVFVSSCSRRFNEASGSGLEKRAWTNGRIQLACIPLAPGHLPQAVCRCTGDVFRLAICPRGRLPLGHLPLGNLPLGNLPLGHLPLGQLFLVTFAPGQIWLIPWKAMPALALAWPQIRWVCYDLLHTSAAIFLTVSAHSFLTQKWGTSGLKTSQGIDYIFYRK